MKITDLLDPRSISLDAAPTSKSETLDKAVELMAASGKLSDVEAFRKQVYAREEESTTGIGEGIAIPHGKCDAVKKPGLAAMVIKNGVDFDSLDGEPVTLLFLIAAPNTKDNVHLDVLSKLSVLMMDENFSDSLRNASSVEDFLSIIDKADAEQAGIDERLALEAFIEVHPDFSFQGARGIVSVAGARGVFGYTIDGDNADNQKAVKEIAAALKDQGWTIASSGSVMR